MKQRARRAAALAAAVTVAVAGCSDDSPAPPSTTTKTSTKTSTTPTQSSTSSASSPSESWSSSSGPNDEHMDAPDVEASPTWDKASRDAATRAAKDVLTAFARPDVPQARWWRDLAPTLTPTARETYKYVAVENVPVREVRGKGRVVDDSSPYLATIEFKTDAGSYTILLSRTGQGAPGLAERIEPKL